MPSTDFLIKVANMELKLKHYDAAEATITKLLDVDPTNASCWYSLALMEFRKENYAKAEAFCLKANEFDDSNGEHWILLSSAQLKQEKYEEAIYNATIGKNIKNDEYDRLALENIAEAQHKQQSFDEAEATYIKLIQTFPEEWKYWKKLYQNRNIDKPASFYVELVLDIKLSMLNLRFAKKLLHEKILRYRASEQDYSQVRAKVMYLVLIKYHAKHVPDYEQQIYKSMVSNQQVTREVLDGVRNYYIALFEAGHRLPDVVDNLEPIAAVKLFLNSQQSLTALSLKNAIDNNIPLPSGDTKFDEAKIKVIEKIKSQNYSP